MYIGTCFGVAASTTPSRLLRFQAEEKLGCRTRCPATEMEYQVRYVNTNSPAGLLDAIITMFRDVSSMLAQCSWLKTHLSTSFRRSGFGHLGFIGCHVKLTLAAIRTTTKSSATTFLLPTYRVERTISHTTSSSHKTLLKIGL